MATAIAYSVVDVGERPYGDTAVRAFFDDASDLGTVVGADLSNYITSDVQQYIADILVQYAGLLAINDVTGSTIAASGVLFVDSTIGALSIDLSDNRWTFGSVASVPIGRDPLIASIVTQVTSQSEFDGALDWYAIVANSSESGNDLIGSLTYILDGATVAPAIDAPLGELDLIIAAPALGPDANDRGVSDDLLLGSGENDDMLGGQGRDIIIGGAGNDRIYGQQGSDYLIGGDGADLLDGGANSGTYWQPDRNILDGGAGDDLIITRSDDDVIGGDGSDVIIYANTHSMGTIRGGAGNDIIRPESDYSNGGTILFGVGDGHDVVYGTPDPSFPYYGIEEGNHYLTISMPDVALSDIQLIWDAHVLYEIQEGEYDHINYAIKGDMAIVLPSGDSIVLKDIVGMDYRHYDGTPPLTQGWDRVAFNLQVYFADYESITWGENWELLGTTITWGSVSDYNPVLI